MRVSAPIARKSFGKLIVVAGLVATLILGAGAGVVVAQGTANPSSDVLYDGFKDAFQSPGVYDEGLTISEFGMSFEGSCSHGGTGIAQTVRLGDKVVQEVIVIVPGDFPEDVVAGDHCTRTGNVSTGLWTTFRRNSN